MEQWQFILNPSGENLEIEEPEGWSDLEISLVRDKIYHGVSIAFSNQALVFDSEGAQIIKTAYELSGIDAEVIFRVRFLCDGEQQYQEDFTIDFGSYKEVCGEACAVSASIEQISCFQQFNGNFDKKVDLDALKTFDGTTDTSVAEWLRHEITLPGKTIQGEDKANMGDPAEQLTEVVSAQPGWVEQVGLIGYLAPALPNTVSSGFGTFLTWSYPAFFAGGYDDRIENSDFPCTVNTSEIAGQLLCDINNVHLSFRLKGRATIAPEFIDPFQFTLTTKIWKVAAGADINNPASWSILYERQLVSITQLDAFEFTKTFDQQASFDVTLVQGDLIYFSVAVRNGTFYVTDFTFVQDTECFFDVVANTVCAPSEAKVYGIYEVMNKVVELITDKCLKVRSNYFGRTDSEPDSYDSDGCGGLRVLTTGLYLRKAEKPTFFLSMRELMEALRSIDNIGFAVETALDQTNQIRVESVDDFYRDTELLRMDNVAEVTKTVKTEEIFGIIKNGYEKWQPQSVNGLDEFNSTREWRTTVKNSNQTLDLTAKFVAAGYLIELARRESFAETNKADTGYDNNTFIICMRRDPVYYAEGMVVEQGGIANPQNLIDPSTVYNFRISPFRNLMRWFKSIAASFRDYTLTGSKLKFSAGDGNITASGNLSDECALEGSAVYDIDSFHTTFAQPDALLLPHLLSVTNFFKLGRVFDVSATANNNTQMTVTGVVDILTHYIIIVTGTVVDEEVDATFTAVADASAKAENQDLTVLDFKDPKQASPLLRPENITFDYPMSLTEFLKVRANPYGYISYQCGTDEWFKGYIFSLRFRIGDGVASIELRNKYT